MKTMTLRNIPDEVALWLTARAGAGGTSVNAATVAVLADAALPGRNRRRRDVSGLFGCWSAAEGRRFDAAVAEAFGGVRTADWEAPK